MPKIVRAVYEGTAPDGQPTRFLTVLHQEPTAFMRLVLRDGVWSPVTVRATPEPTHPDIKDVWIPCVRVQ